MGGKGGLMDGEGRGEETLSSSLYDDILRLRKLHVAWCLYELYDLTQAMVCLRSFR
jgi:hypothetical protein